LLAYVKDADQEGNNLYNNYWIMDEPIALFDFCDAKNDKNEYHNKHVTLGQQKDIDRLHYAYQKICERYPDENVKIVFVGISRGSVAILNYMGLHHPSRVKALVLESPFDKFKNVVKHLLRRFHVYWVPFSDSIGMKIAQTHFPSLDTRGIFPSITATAIEASIPIILIHSIKDKVIPVNSSRALYLALKNSGHEHTYLLELASGSHGKLMAGSCAQIYQDTVHAFYKKYDIPHNPEYALRGEPLLAETQPSVGDVRKKQKKYKTLGDDYYSQPIA
jgi:alpha-beta hydrolase superfamily lysophospholipase